MKLGYFCLGILIITLNSCYSENDLKQRYNRGYSEGRAVGRSEGYNTAKAEYEKRMNDLQTRVTTMERNHRNKIAAMEGEHRNSLTALERNHRSAITTMQDNHRRDLTIEYNRGFQAGEASMETKILAIVDVRAQEAIRRNRRNEPLFRLR